MCSRLAEVGGEGVENGGFLMRVHYCPRFKSEIIQDPVCLGIAYDKQTRSPLESGHRQRRLRSTLS